MKNIYYLSFLLFLTACIYDDNIHAPEEGTDFTQDISDITNFNLSTPVELKVLDKNIETSDSLVYKIGDTLKLSLEINKIHQETLTEFYNIHESTGSEYYQYSIYFDYTYTYNSNYIKAIDLELLKKYPEIINNNLTDTNIKTHPIYKNLFVNTEKTLLKYNSDSQKYISRIGIVLEEEKSINLTDIQYSERAINTNSDKNIKILIPIISALDNGSKKLIITK